MRYIASVLVVTMLFAAGCCSGKGATAQQFAENRPTAPTGMEWCRVGLGPRWQACRGVSAGRKTASQRSTGVARRKNEAASILGGGCKSLPYSDL